MSGQSEDFGAIARSMRLGFDELYLPALRRFVVACRKHQLDDVAAVVVHLAVSAVSARANGERFEIDDDIDMIVITMDRAAAGDDSWSDVMILVARWRESKERV